MARPFFTIGHSTRAIGEFVDLLRGAEVELVVDSHFPGDQPSEEWSNHFERRIRDVASQAVAHLKRGDRVTLHAKNGERARADGTLGADPLLRFLALLEPHTEGAALSPRTPVPTPRETPPSPDSRVAAVPPGVEV